MACRPKAPTHSAPLLALACVATVSMPALADVTVQQAMSIDARIVKMDTTITESISADKRRNESETHCHGLLSLVCRDVQSGEIVRLDKQLEWQLEPKKKTYVEKNFPTPEQRAEAQKQMQEMLDKMKECQQQRQASSAESGPDTSRCELSKPTISVMPSDEHLTLAGHDTRKSSIILSQTCTDKQTGDICRMDYTFDSWLTKDDIPGAAERKTFQQKYLAAQGLDPSAPQFQGAMRQFLAQYGDQLKELNAHASSLKGYPLRTTFSMSFGGEHCGKAKEQATQSASNGGGIRDLGLKGLASSAVGSKLAGIFSRHGAGGAVSSAAGQAGANATGAAADAAAQSAADSGKASGTQTAGPATATNMLQVISFTIDTKSIDTASIPADRFEIPAGWKLRPPKAAKEREFSCSANGSS